MIGLQIHEGFGSSDDAAPAPKKPRPECVGVYCGLKVYSDLIMLRGMVEFRDAAGNVMGTIYNVGSVTIGEAR